MEVGTERAPGVGHQASAEPTADGWKVRPNAGAETVRVNVGQGGVGRTVVIPVDPRATGTVVKAWGAGGSSARGTVRFVEEVPATPDMATASPRAIEYFRLWRKMNSIEDWHAGDLEKVDRLCEPLDAAQVELGERMTVQEHDQLQAMIDAWLDGYNNLTPIEISDYEWNGWRIEAELEANGLALWGNRVWAVIAWLVCLAVFSAIIWALLFGEVGLPPAVGVSAGVSFEGADVVQGGGE